MALLPLCASKSNRCFMTMTKVCAENATVVDEGQKMIVLVRKGAIVGDVVTVYLRSLTGLDNFRFNNDQPAGLGAEYRLPHRLLVDVQHQPKLCNNCHGTISLVRVTDFIAEAQPN